MGENLADKVHELFSRVGEKPCIDDSVRVGTTAVKENSTVTPGHIEEL
jgi:hypothetical protein